MLARMDPNPLLAMWPADRDCRQKRSHCGVVLVIDWHAQSGEIERVWRPTFSTAGGAVSSSSVGLDGFVSLTLPPFGAVPAGESSAASSDTVGSNAIGAATAQAENPRAGGRPIEQWQTTRQAGAVRARARVRCGYFSKPHPLPAAPPAGSRQSASARPQEIERASAALAGRELACRQRDIKRRSPNAERTHRFGNGESQLFR